MRHAPTLTAVLALVCLVSVSSTVSAETITIEASDDAYGQMGYYNPDYGPTNNWGDLDYMLTKWDGSIWSRKAWVQFDISEVTNQWMASATFQITKSGDSTGAGTLTLEVVALHDGDSAEAWDESDTSYSTAPANQGYENVNGWDPGRTTDMRSTNLQYFTTTPAGTVLEFSNQELLNAVNSDTDGRLSLLLVQTPNNGYAPSWATHEHVTYAGPTLVLEVPDPPPDVLLPMADSYGVSGSPDMPGENNEEFLRVKNDPGGAWHRKTWIRYDLSQLTGHSAVDASLLLTLFEAAGTDETITINVSMLNDGDPGESWDESSLTWNNAPGNHTTSGSALLGNTTLLGSFTFITPAAAGDYFTFSSPALADAINADSDELLTLILHPQTPALASMGVASRENIDLEGPPNFFGPRLVVTTVPAPTTLALLALGGLGLLLRRRRQP